MRLFDLNEAAFAYHRHCLSTSQNISPQFMEVLDFVANELFAEARNESPGLDPRYIRSKILERRYRIQYKLDSDHIKEGCHSAATDMAQSHYEAFSNYSRQDIEGFIERETGG